MKSLSFIKMTRWQTALFIALILAGQNAYSIDSANFTKNECVEVLSPTAALRNKIHSIKTNTAEFTRELYKTRGLRLFLTDLDPETKNFHNMLVTYAPFIESGSLFARLRNSLTLLNPFRWIGATIKNQKYKFSPLTSSLNYVIEKLSKKTMNNPKQLSGFSTLLVQATFILTMLDPGLTALSDKIEEITLIEHREHVEQNKEHYQHILDTDYRYKGIDKRMEEQLDQIMAANLVNNLRSMAGMDTISMEQLRTGGEEYYTAYDSVTNGSLLETFLLESEYEIWKEKLTTIDRNNLSLEKNKSEFCDLILFNESCYIADEISPDGHHAVVNETFNLTHDLYVSYDMVDAFTSQVILDLDLVNTENLYIKNAKQFIEELVEFYNKGLLALGELNYLIKQDAHIQFNQKIDVTISALSGEISSREEIEAADLQARETVNAAREAIIVDLIRSQSQG